METWTSLRSDSAVGAERALEVAAICATLVDPAITALKLEASEMANDGTETAAYLIHDRCQIHGQPVATANVKAWLLADGKTPEPPHWDTIPVLDAQAGIHNAKALLQWHRTGQQHRLALTDGSQRTLYAPGSVSLAPSAVTTGQTHSLAKAAALGRLGISLHTFTGSPSSPGYVLHLTSEPSPLVDADGEPVIYHLPSLIMGEIAIGDPHAVHPELPLDHPFILAYRAARCWLDLKEHFAKEAKALVITPDAIRKGKARYNPHGKHALIHPNAPGKVWDQVGDRFFR